MAWGYTNDYSSTILAYTSGAGSITVVSVTGLPTSGMYFILKVDNEYFLCTSYIGLVLTVTGGQAGSTPANHSLGAAITGCWIVPQVLDGIKSDIVSAGNFASLPSSPVSGQVYFFTNSIFDRAIYNGSVWIYFIGGMVVTPANATSFTWQNQSTATVDETYGGEYIISAVGATANNINGRYVAYPGGTFTLTVAVKIDLYLLNITNGFGGLYLSDGTKVLIYGIYGPSPSLAYQSGSSMTNINANVFTPISLHSAGLYWLRMDDGVTASGKRTWFFSYDNKMWRQIYQENNTEFLTPTRIGLFAGSYETGSIVVTWAAQWLVQ